MPMPGPSTTPEEKRNNWGTPPPWLSRARQVMGGIDLDPASSVRHNERVQASRIYTIEDNGLEQPWFGRTFCNPPFGRGLITPFCMKMVTEWGRVHDGKLFIPQMISLTNSDTSTQWSRLLFESAHLVCFPYKRLKFIDEDTGEPILVWDKKTKKWKIGGNNRPQAFWYWGENTGGFHEVFGEVGTVLPLPSLSR